MDGKQKSESTQHASGEALAFAQESFDRWMSIGEFGMAFTVARTYFPKSDELTDARIEQVARLYIKDLLEENNPSDALDIANDSCPGLVTRCATAYYDKHMLEGQINNALLVAKSYLPDYVSQTQTKIVEQLFSKQRYGEVVPFAQEEKMPNVENLTYRVFQSLREKKLYSHAYNFIVTYPQVLNKFRLKILPYALNQYVNYFERNLLKSHLEKDEEAKKELLNLARSYEECVTDFIDDLPTKPILKIQCEETDEPIEYNLEERIDNIKERMKTHAKTHNYYYLTLRLDEAVQKQKFELAGTIRDQLKVEETLIKKNLVPVQGGEVSD